MCHFLDSCVSLVPGRSERFFLPPSGRFSRNYKMASSGMKMNKCLLLVFNLIFTLGGCGLVGAGVYIQVQQLHGHETTDVGIVSMAPIISIIVGSSVAIIGFFGCCGALAENKCMLLSFSILLAFAFMGILAAGIFVYINKDKLEEVLKPPMEESFYKYNRTKPAKEFWDFIQTELGCCGLDGPLDWMDRLNWTRTPDSCCSVQNEACLPYEKGCIEAEKEFIRTEFTLIGGVAIGVAIITIVGIVMACCLVSAINNEKAKQYIEV